MEVRFIFKSSSGKRQTHAKRLPVLLGRSDSGEVKLRIDRDSVSRRHCEFTAAEDGTVEVRDLESTNGTFLDGRKLQPRVATPVPSGAVMKVGDLSFRVEYSVGEPTRSQGGHDSETIPIEAAPAAGDAPLLEAADDVTQATGVTAAAPADGDSFGFLADGEPAAETEGWPEAGPAAAGEDAGLDDFLKGLP